MYKKLIGDLHDSRNRGTLSENDDTDSGMANLFNSAIGASAIAAVYELGLFGELQQNNSIRVKDFCEKNDLHHSSVSSLLHVLCCFEVIDINPEEDVIQKGAAFSNVYRDKGYFLWLVGGYGYLLQHLSSALRNKFRTGDFIRRNGERIASAARDYGSQFVDPHFIDMLKQEPYQFVADLGCGSAERLINLARNQPNIKGTGIDINSEAIKLAKQAVASANLQERITILHGDIKELTNQPELQRVEVIFSFFMAHDLWPRPKCLQTLRDLHYVFPRAERLLLCDTYRSDLAPSREMPIFTLGFELTHAVMGQYIPSVSEWIDLFTEAGWSCVEQRNVGIPFSCIFDLRNENQTNRK